LLAVATALYFVASPFPPIQQPRDVFDFTSMRRPAAEMDPPSLQRYKARDGEELAYRLYASTAERILIFVHGSSYHGGGYHALAAFLSLGGTSKVVLPNLRGHYQSGRYRGDVEYIGQFEDDLADLIQYLRGQNRNGPITLGGHSSGGGLVIRFAGGAHANAVSRLSDAGADHTVLAVSEAGQGRWVGQSALQAALRPART
jgi:non-heme chloroperoxidase